MALQPEPIMIWSQNSRAGTHFPRGLGPMVKQQGRPKSLFHLYVLEKTGLLGSQETPTENPLKAR